MMTVVGVFRSAKARSANRPQRAVKKVFFMGIILDKYSKVENKFLVSKKIRSKALRFFQERFFGKNSTFFRCDMLNFTSKSDR